MPAMEPHPVLLEKLNAGLEPARLPQLTPRDARLPKVAGKAHAVIGMRRVGKTTFLRQMQREWQQAVGPERAIYISFDDDRLADVPLAELDRLLEEYYRRFPSLRSHETVYWLFDEIQGVPGWERFVRRILDTERVEVVVSGSSARLLSREVHTSLRGRSMETVIRPFSFREFLRHRGEEPEKSPARFTAAERSLVEKRFGEYLVEGGFPEAQGLTAELRTELLQGYVTTLLLRDVVERYGITQVAALRWLVRQCLRNPAGSFSVHRFSLDLRSQGLGIAKDALHALLGHLEDAFLVHAVPLSTDSERRRNSNPRKIYPSDPGLIRAFDVSRRAHLGHALETVVMVELARRKAELGYVKTRDGYEADFHARFPDGREELIQVCADPTGSEARERELRALNAAVGEFPHATPRLLVLNRDQALALRSHAPVAQPTYAWLLEDGGEG
ncbi:MAG: ATP-binding protein [Planctomycetes bacterium]|nr:ATP-binding protein [Planctomycetota bacterium]